jgi:hypothetical protein
MTAVRRLPGLRRQPAESDPAILICGNATPQKSGLSDIDTPGERLLILSGQPHHSLGSLCLSSRPGKR